MKQKRKFEILIMLFAFVFSYLTLTFIFNRQLTSNETRIKNFYYEDENSLDMVMIGSSMVFTGYSAPLAWKEQGYTSYVLGVHSAPMGIMKSMIKEIKKRQNPKVILIDFNAAMYGDKPQRKEAALRYWIDNMEMSQNKIDTINELVPEEERASYFFPFIKYHNNWSEVFDSLEMTKLQLKSMIMKENLSVSGMNGTTLKDNRRKFVNSEHNEKRKALSPVTNQDLQDLLKYLKDNSVENVGFVIMPRYYDAKMLNQRALLNEASDIVKSQGFKVYDFEREMEAIGLKKIDDFYNADHLNFYGQRKMTEYFGRILKKDFDLKGMHNDKTISKWNQEYKSYEKVYQWGTRQIDQGINFRYDHRILNEIFEGREPDLKTSDKSKENPRKKEKAKSEKNKNGKKNHQRDKKAKESV